MALLTLDQILEAEDRATRVVPMPEWGGDVRITVMSGADRDAFEASLLPEKNGKPSAKMQNFRARLISKCLVDEEGKCLVPPAKVEQLGKKSASALSRLFDECRELNGMSEKDISRLYGRLIRPGSDVLDLMASWTSHLPADLQFDSLTVLGMNPDELEANARATERRLHDLNRRPILPFADARFDAVICTVSVEYLTSHFDVFGEVDVHNAFVY